MNLSISIFVLLVLCVSLATIAVAELTIDEVRKFKIAELKQRLKAKGLTCNGCAEKDDYVNLYMSNQNLPDVVVDKEASKPSSDSSDSNSENKNIDEVMAALKASGLSGAKIYTKEDIEKMTNMGGGDFNSKSKKPRMKKSKMSKKKEDVTEKAESASSEL